MCSIGLSTINPIWPHGTRKCNRLYVAGDSWCIRYTITFLRYMQNLRTYCRHTGISMSVSEDQFAVNKQIPDRAEVGTTDGLKGISPNADQVAAV